MEKTIKATQIVVISDVMSVEKIAEGGLADYKDALAYSASLCFILSMLAPVPTCYRFMRNKSVGDMSALPYISAYQSCSLWLMYGIVINDMPIAQPNILAGFLQLCYVFCYYVNCTNKSSVRRQMSVATSVVLLTLLYCLLESNHDVLVYRLGLLCCFITFLFFASPLATLRHVIKVRNADSLPGLFILFTFIVSVQWSLYGVIIDDMFVQVPNILGSILSGFQLLLILLLPSSGPTKILPT